MPNDADDQEPANEKGNRSQPATPEENHQWQWFQLPAPIKRIFDEFPLRSYPANQLPQSASINRDRHALYIFASDEGAGAGRPSFNPGCLKWQTYLKFQKVDFQCTSSSNHASPTGALPFLLPAASALDSPSPINSNGIQRWIRDQRQSKGRSTTERDDRARPSSRTEASQRHADRAKAQQQKSSEMRYDAYMSLLNHKIRNAYLYSLYISPLNFESIVFPLYIAPTTTNTLVRLALARQLRSAAEAELLKEAAVIDVQFLHRESERAFAALSTLLGDDDEYFFGDSEPSLFDASVFAYTNILLDRDLNWQVRHLVEGLEKHQNLVRHRARILERYYNTKT